MVKPSVRMKTVVKTLEKCLADDCKGCYLKEENNCMTFLMMDCLYYMKQTLEKSEKEKK